MARVAIKHDTMVGPNRVRTVMHFTRTEMCAQHARGMRQTARDLPSKQIDVYESDHVVVIERNLT